MANIIQWNVNSLKGKLEILQKLIIDENIDIICLQETNLKRNETVKLSNYTSYNKNRTDCKAASGGVSISIKNTFHSQELILNLELEAVAATITINNKQITICNVYLSNRHDTSYEQIEQLINRLPSPFILLGDFNSHHSLWGSYKTDKKGKIIEELLLRNELALLIDKSPTHFDAANASLSSIDLTHVAIISLVYCNGGH